MFMQKEEEMTVVRKGILNLYQKEHQKLKDLIFSAQGAVKSEGQANLDNLINIMGQLSNEDKERQRMRINNDSKIKQL